MAAPLNKVFNDPVHGHIALEPILVKIIDTPEFQRLRDIKQLGATYFVYSGASHNRFEHSIGVCHLAGELVKKIKENQTDLNIDETDVLCVKIAGLCHDLGHGIMSHLFERFIHKEEQVEQEVQGQGDRVNLSQKKTHEHISAVMFDHLIEKNNIKQYLADNNIGGNDIKFIKEQIEGPPYQGRTLEGRDDSKRFLYEIVGNKRNGVDVDKWDYMLRDCQQLGMKCSIDLSRFLQYARVIKVNDEYQICLRDKQASDLYIMMQTRKMLHDRAYRHRVANIITAMLIDALKKANDHLKFKGKILGPEQVRQEYKMTDAYQDMEAFKQLTDNIIFSRILYSEDPNLEESRKLVERILQRRLYVYINSGIYSELKDRIYVKDQEDKVKKDILKCCCNGRDDLVEPDDFVVTIINSDYGMGKDDPVQNIRFYSKDNPNKGKIIQRQKVSSTIANCFSDQRVEIYSRSDDEAKIDRLQHLFYQWCEKKDFLPTKPENGNGHNGEARGGNPAVDVDNSGGGPN